MTVTPSASKAVLESLFAKITPQASTLGAEALESMFAIVPQTKNYFAQYDLSHGSADLLTLGGKMFNALGNAVKNLDDLAKYLSSLRNRPFPNFLVDSRNAELLSHFIQITLAVNFPDDFTTETQTAFKKFLSEVFTILASKTNK